MHKFGLQKLFSWILPLLDVLHCCKLSLYAISRKLMMQTGENGKKPSFMLDFSSFGPNLGPKKFFVYFASTTYYCCKLSLYATSRKTNKPNLRKWQKNLVSGPILTTLAQIWAPKIFFHAFYL